jgi:hypothetical protein
MDEGKGKKEIRYSIVLYTYVAKRKSVDIGHFSVQWPMGLLGLGPLLLAIHSLRICTVDSLLALVLFRLVVCAKCNEIVRAGDRRGKNLHAISWSTNTLHIATG